MRQASLPKYLENINQMITDTEETGSTMYPYYQEIVQAMEDNAINQELLVKAYTQFEAGMEKYDALMASLEKMQVPVKLMGMHKQLVSAYRHYFEACREMLVAVNPEKGFDEAKFKESEQDQDTYSQKITGVIGRMTAGMMR